MLCTSALLVGGVRVCIYVCAGLGKGGARKYVDDCMRVRVHVRVRVCTCARGCGSRSVGVCIHTHICVCVCVCGCVRVDLYFARVRGTHRYIQRFAMNTYIHIYFRMTYIYMHIHGICVYTCMYIYIQIYVCVNIYIYMYTHICIYMYTHIYICIYMYIHIHKYTYHIRILQALSRSLVVYITKVKSKTNCAFLLKQTNSTSLQDPPLLSM